ncbi:MAG: hypothetical protein GEU78_16780, partial [Actinobacteria bacterium]|nr:hypothetical protein [Actinomycetota bacterium]
MSDQPPLAKVERACSDLAAARQPITFTAVAQRAQLGRTTLYRNPDLRAVVEEHRTRAADARSLSGLATEIAHLRTAMHAVAERVKGHEERL